MAVTVQPGMNAALDTTVEDWVQRFTNLEKVNVLQFNDVAANTCQQCQFCVPNWRHKIFKVTDENDDVILEGEDETDGVFCCLSSCLLGCSSCGPSLAYEFKDKTGEKVLTLRHPIRCCGRLLEMSGPDDNVLASASKTFSLCSILDFDILDTSQNTLYNVNGPTCLSCECGGLTYHIRSHDGRDVGKISVSWDGVCGCCCCSCCDCALWKFEVSFPRELDVYHKLMMVGSVFLVEVMAERAREGI